KEKMKVLKAKMERCRLYSEPCIYDAASFEVPAVELPAYTPTFVTLEHTFKQSVSARPELVAGDPEFGGNPMVAIFADLAASEDKTQVLLILPATFQEIHGDTKAANTTKIVAMQA